MIEVLKGRHRWVVGQCDCGVSKWVRKSSVVQAQRKGRNWMCPTCAHRVGANVWNAKRRAQG